MFRSLSKRNLLWTEHFILQKIVTRVAHHAIHVGLVVRTRPNWVLIVLSHNRKLHLHLWVWSSGLYLLLLLELPSWFSYFVRAWGAKVHKGPTIKLTTCQTNHCMGSILRELVVGKTEIQQNCKTQCARSAWVLVMLSKRLAATTTTWSA